MTTPVKSSSTQRSERARKILGAPFTFATWRRTAYGVLSLPVAAVYFALTVPTLLISTALIIVFGLGILFTLAVFWLSRVFAWMERARGSGMIGAVLSPPIGPTVFGGPFKRWWQRCRSPVTWRTLGFMLTNLPLSAVTCFLCAYPWVQTFYSLSYPIIQWNTTFTEHAWGGPSWLGAVAVHTLPGVPMLFAAPWIVRGATAIHVAWVRYTLADRRVRR